MSSDRDLKEKMDPEVQALVERYRRLPLEDVKRLFAEAVNVTRDGIIRASAAFAVLEERGEKPNGDPALFNLFRKVASERWSPDAIIRFGTERYVMKKILAMPRAEQDAILQKTDEEVRQEVKRPAEAKEEKTPQPQSPGQAEQKTVRHVTTNHAYDELKREYDLYKLESQQNIRALERENEQLRGRVADLQRAFDVAAAKQSRRCARPVGV